MVVGLVGSVDPVMLVVVAVARVVLESSRPLRFRDEDSEFPPHAAMKTKRVAREKVRSFMKILTASGSELDKVYKYVSLCEASHSR